MYIMTFQGFPNLILKYMHMFDVCICMDSSTRYIIVLVIANCPSGYTQHGNSCYVINRVQASWAQASVSTFRPTSPLCRGS